MVVLKIEFNGDIRRLTVDTPITFQSLTELVSNLFKSLPKSLFYRYIDDEGDEITIASDLELNEALRLAHQSGIFKLKIVENKEEKEEEADLEEFLSTIEDVASQFLPLLFSPYQSPNPCGFRGFVRHGHPFWHHCRREEARKIHPAICDECNERIMNIRFKCNQCFDYDLCEGCKQKEGVHAADHTFVKIEDPSASVHPAICDSCDNTIVGVRYKCSSCIDYDLCQACAEKDGVHDATHKFYRIDRPFPFGFRFRGCSRSGRSCHASDKQSDSQQQKQEKEEVTQPQQPTKEEVAVDGKQEEMTDVSSKESVKEEKKGEERVNISSERAASPSVRAPTTFELKLKQLEEMGFGNRQQNIALLLQNNLDMVNTVKDLLDN